MESTEAGRPTDASPHTQWCVVFDSTTGAVVHIHQFIALSRADACSPDELSKQAIEQARYRQGGRALKVGHPSDDTPLDYNGRYRVDPATGRVLVEKLRRVKPSTPVR